MDTLTNNFRKTIERFTALPENDWNNLVSSMEIKIIRKGDYFIREGQVCQHIGFLNTGILRVYYHENGKEFTSYFNFGNRNPLISAFTSFFLRQPSKENIHALEDAEIGILHYDKLQTLFESSFSMQKLGRLMAEYNYILAMERIYSLQHQSATERYNHLLHIYPQLINHIPHHYIASYLGITPESLSRIRKSME